MSKDSFQLIFHFWFVRRPQNCAIIRHGPRDKTKIREEILAPQQKSQYFWFYRQKLVICSEIPFSKNSYHMETSPMICFANWMVSIWYKFSLKGISEHINSRFLVILLSKSYLWQWLNIPSKVGHLRAARSGQ